MLQGIAGVALQLEGVAKQTEVSPLPLSEDVRRVRRQLERLITEARHAIWDLRTPALETRTLAAALSELGARLMTDSAERFRLTVIGKPRVRHPEIEEQLLRIGQEAIRNAVRHGQAQRIDVELTYQKDSIRLVVSDDGHGFEPEEHVVRQGPRWGLVGMQERANRIGAQFRITSTPGSGTKVETMVRHRSRTIDLDDGIRGDPGADAEPMRIRPTTDQSK
jgi:signal transduction histidine kinase